MASTVCQTSAADYFSSPTQRPQVSGIFSISKFSFKSFMEISSEGFGCQGQTNLELAFDIYLNLTSAHT